MSKEGWKNHPLVNQSQIKEESLKIKKSIEYYRNGDIWREKWHIKGDEYYLHKENGPAHISYYDTGKKDYEGWYINNKLHRIDGPAHISYYKDGTVRFEHYYINGERLSKKQWENHLLRQEYLVKKTLKCLLDILS